MVKGLTALVSGATLTLDRGVRVAGGGPVSA